MLLRKWKEIQTLLHEESAFYSVAPRLVSTIIVSFKNDSALIILTTTAMLAQTLYYKLKLFLQKLSHDRRTRRFIRVFKALVLLSGVLALVFVIAFIIWLNQPTQSTFATERIYELTYPKNPTPVVNSAATPQKSENQPSQSTSDSTPAPLFTGPPKFPDSALFDYRDQTFALMVHHPEPTLVIRHNKEERSVTPEDFFPQTQALRIHNPYLVLVLNHSSPSTPYEPLTVSFAFLNIKANAPQSFVKTYTNFLLPYSHQAWQTMLPKITLHSYGRSGYSGFTLRLAKETLISIAPTGVAQWIHIGTIVRPLLNAQTTHFETVLTSDPHKIYIVLIDNGQTPHQFNILLYDLKQSQILNHYTTELSQASYFTINDYRRLITTSFSSLPNEMHFKIEPLEKIPFLSDFFSLNTSNKTLIKTLTFTNNLYPKGLRFNGQSFIGFYETAERVEFWHWY